MNGIKLLKLINKEKISNRGNRIVSFGYSGCQKFKNNIHERSQPLPLKRNKEVDTDIYQEYELYCDMLTTLTKKFVSVAFHDENRQRFTDSVGFESLGFALLSNTDKIARHRDTYNDTRDGYDYCTVVSHGVKIGIDYERFASIGYTRFPVGTYVQAVRDHYGRDNVGDELMELKIILED